MNYYCDHNICPVNTTLPMGTDTIQVCRNVRMERISALCNIEEEELRRLNPQYRTNLIPGHIRPCTLRMPTAAINAFIEAGDSIYVPQSEVLNIKEVPAAAKAGKNSKRSGSTITVRRGDTLGAIAKRNRTTVARLKKLNGLQSNNIRAGQRLKVN